MKILMVSEFYPPILGGVAQHVSSLAESLVQKGHNVVVLTLGWKGLKHYENNGIEIIRYSGLFQRLSFIYGNKNYRFHPPINDPIFSRKIYKLVKSFKPDLIHCHGWTIYSMFNIKICLNVPLIFTLHDYGLMCPARTMFNNKGICQKAFTPECKICANKKVGKTKASIMCWTLAHYQNSFDLVDKYIAVSQAVKEIHSKYIDTRKIEVINNFYNYKEKQGVKSNSSLPKSFIMFAGALKKEKGVDILINAYKKLNTDVKLVLLGMKRPGFTLQGEENIIILENQPHHVVMEAWRKCQIAIVPSVWAEPFGIVALEAMGCGKPIIGSNIGGLKDIVRDGETGFLVPPGDEESLSTAINKLIDDPNFAREMGIKGQRRLIETFSQELIIEKIEELYNRTIENE